MIRFVAASVALLAVAALAPVHAAPREEVSRYERDVLQAQKRLIKHRKEKAKALLKRQRLRANRVYRQ
jgi:hypothetical protein